MKSHTNDPKYYYFTASSDGTRIDAEAHVHRAASVAEMLAAMHAMHCWNDSVVGYEEGGFSDCWAKCLSEPRQDDFERWSAYYGIPSDCFIVRAPGTHPGGNFWWVDISIPIYVPVIKVEE